MKKCITLVFIFVAINLQIIISFAVPQNIRKTSIADHYENLNESNCPELKHCNCSMNGGYITVNCINLQNFTQLMAIVRQKFSNRTIGHIYISHSNIDNLPANAFAGLNILNIYIRRTVIRSVDNNVFVGTNQLVELRLDDMNLLTFPTSIPLLGLTLRCLWMNNGQLRALGTELSQFTRLQVLSLKHNNISYVDSEAFLNLVELNQLNLANNSIKFLNSITFGDLQRLQILFLLNNNLQSVEGLFKNHQFTIQTIQLQNNELRSIHNITDRPLYSLHSLFLSNNPIEIVDKDSFGNNFPQLKILLLDSTHLIRIDSQAFQHLTHLRRVILDNNKLDDLNGVFANIQSLQEIGLASNRIKNIENFFTRTSEVENLYLSNNKIQDIENCFNRNKLLRVLLLDKNNIQKIHSGMFLNNKKLHTLVLDQNKIEYLEKDSFRGLYLLKRLYLSRNRIYTLNGSLDNLPQLENLFLNDNRLVFLDSKQFQQTLNLNIIDLSYNNLTSVEKAFQNLQNLQIIKLTGNYLKTLTEETFSSQSSINDLQIRRNPISCDCRIGWLIEAVSEHRFKLDRVQCGQPEWLRGKRITNLSLIDVSVWKTNCPESCDCRCHANFTNFYINVNCANRNLDRMPDMFPEKMNSLDVSHNEIQVIPSNSFGNLSHLQHLLLHFNNLTKLSDLKDYMLKTLTLSNNKLTLFPVDFVNEEYLETVSLSENPWICDCQTLPFVKWILSEQNKILDVNQTRCSSDNKNFKLHRIISLTEPQLCPSFILLYSIIGAVVAVILLFIAGGKIIYNRYRIHILVWLYSRGFSCLKEDDFNENKQFDAFISYSRLDEFFVDHMLVPNLENGEKSFHLCIHYRHFAPGTYIPDNIMNAVKASKRTLMVLSRNFLSSEWCRLEFKSAHHQVLEERLNRLIVIILGDLPAEEEIDSEILLYLQTTTYLRWGEKNFWNKLYYAMPKTPCDLQDRERVRLLGDDN